MMKRQKKEEWVRAGSNHPVYKASIILTLGLFMSMEVGGGALVLLELSDASSA
jgi:hypothetical protein